MSARSDFTDDEWTALTEAPLDVMVTMFAAGQHGPIATIKESTAGAHAMTRPGDRGPASGLIAEIIPLAEGKQARHDAGHMHGSSIDEVIDASVARLAPAAAALAKLPADESSQFAAWLVDIGAAVAGASKGVSDRETKALDRIASTFGITRPAG
jgi:hypothetical protein